MKKKLFGALALLLGIALAVSLLPAVVADDAGKVLYSWTSAELADDMGALTTNLVSKSGTKTRWNTTGVLYGDTEAKQVKIHNMLNTGAGRGNNAYGLPHSWDDSGKIIIEQNLAVDVYFNAALKGYKAANVKLTYAYNPAGDAANAATSGNLQIFASKNGNWSDPITVRSARVVGSGFNDGKSAVFYEIQSSDLIAALGATDSDSLRAVRIMPDGARGTAAGEFALCDITVTGYTTKSGFRHAVPTAAALRTGADSAIDADAIRSNIVKAAAASKATTQLGRVNDAIQGLAPTLTDVVSIINSDDFRAVAGVQLEANERVRQVLEWFTADWKQGSSILDKDIISAEKREAILAKVNTNTSTKYIITEHNTPQQVLHAYGNAKPGDLLISVLPGTDGTTDNFIYVLTGTKPVFLNDEVSIDPNASTLTYIDENGKEKSFTYTAAITTNYALPYAVAGLVSGNLSMDMDVHASLVDGAHVVVSASMPITACTVEIEGQNKSFNVTAGLGGTTVLYSSKQLDGAIASLADGDYVLKVTATFASIEKTESIPFAVKGGKATAKEAGDHAATCPAKAMTDVDKSAWYHEAADYALANGIMSGYSATTFGPNNNLSRAIVVQMIYNKEGKPAVSAGNTFTDNAKGQWYYDAVRWSAANKVVAGYPDGTFHPDDNVTVEQAAVILWNYAGTPASSADISKLGAHSDWSTNALRWCVANDILDNVPYKSLTGSATRAQMAQILMNYLEN